MLKIARTNLGQKNFEFRIIMNVVTPNHRVCILADRSQELLIW